MEKISARLSSKIYVYLVPVLIALMLLGVSLGLAIFFRGEVAKQSEKEFLGGIAVEAQGLTVRSDELLNEYSGVLLAARGLFDASVSVERDEWRAYIESQNLEDNFPALSALEYVRRVDDSEKSAYVESVQDDDLIVGGGYPDFAITPERDEEEYYVVHYVEPFEGNEAAFGFDLFSNPSRKEAIELARDTNSVVVTEPITLVQEKSEQKALPADRQAFLILLPVYEQGGDIETLEGRRENIIGLVLGVVRAEDLFSQVLLSSSLIHIDGVSVEDITSGGGQDLLPFIGKNGLVTSVVRKKLSGVQKARISVGTRIWEMEFLTSQVAGSGGVESLLPPLLLVFGVVISVSVGLTLYNALRLRFRAEEIAKELTRDLAKFHLAVEGASNHIIITDPDGVVLYANPAASITTGYSNKEIIGAKPSLWGGLMKKEFYKGMWDTVKVKKEAYKGQLVNKRKDGKKYNAEIYIAPVLDEQGKVIHFVGIERDITKEKQLQKLLEQEKMLKEEQSESMLERIAEGIVITNEASEVTYVNPGLVSVLGFGLKDFKGKGFDEVVKAFDIEGGKAVSVKMLGVEDGEKKLLVQGKGGEKKAVSIATSEVAVKGESKGTVSVVHDFTEDYEIQRKKDEFFAIASHEMRTPLTSISGNIDMVLSSKAKLGVKEKGMLADSLGAAGGLVRIVDNLLVVSEMDVGKIEVSKVEVDVGEVLGKSMESFDEIVKEKKIKIVNNVAVGKFKIKTDERLLKRITLNMLDNAVKFTQKGSVTVDVEEKDGKVLLRFSDTGIGISADNQKYLFGRFQQAMEDVLARDAGGTGIGLYISKSLAEMLGGDVRLEKSELGKGSVFVVEVENVKDDAVSSKEDTKKEK